MKIIKTEAYSEDVLQVMKNTKINCEMTLLELYGIFVNLGKTSIRDKTEHVRGLVENCMYSTSHKALEALLQEWQNNPYTVIDWESMKHLLNSEFEKLNIAVDYKE